MNKLTKEQIDNHFNYFQPQLLNIVGVFLRERNRTKMDHWVVINEAYLHVIKNQDKLNNTTDLEKMLVHWCKMNIIWEQSQINKQERVNNQGEEYVRPDEVDTIENDIQSKIEIDRWYNERNAILQMYYQTEQELLYKAVFEAYFRHGKITIKAMSEYLGVNREYVRRYIKEMKKRIDDFIKNNI